ncbi:hypothetical protein N8T08_001701 [Aspergillus melleus]|uniref:Uncharacterized protein n=1 Tax=Aspergillus melleus TaxID=138277 RepID=A0ACC3AMY4_9EURO|nr:hypothetical protein N8T08_001701 [Aspergillus melleus]
MPQELLSMTAVPCVTTEGLVPPPGQTAYPFSTPMTRPTYRALPHTGSTGWHRTLQLTALLEELIGGETSGIRSHAMGEFGRTVLAFERSSTDLPEFRLSPGRLETLLDALDAQRLCYKAGPVLCAKS